MTPTPRLDRPIRLLLSLAFGAIAALLVLTQVVSYFRSREVQANVDLIAEDALASIRRVQRLGTDIQRQRILIDRHILERDIIDMDRTEKQIAAIGADYADTARQYAALAPVGEEASAWLRLQDDVGATDAAYRAALALSRKNLDPQAREALSAAEPSYAAVERDVDLLVAINQTAADQALMRVRQVQHSMLVLRSVLALAGVLITLVLGFSVTRLVARGEDQLKHYAGALELRNRELDAFAGRVAHDLRGPLTAISLSASRLFERMPQDEGGMAIFRRGVQRMEELIDDLLSLSRITAEAAGMICQIEIVASAIEADLGPKVTEVDGRLRLQMQPARVRCSEGLLREVLWNLGENAVKYRRPEVPLQLEMIGHATHQHYELRVSDNGSGMSSSDARRAFDPLFRGEQARSTTPGTGLGLAIVKRIVEASGGTVTVDSHVGQGTLFVVRLPLAGEPAARPTQ
jgi:signal transduction histidine kinase